VPTHLLPIEHSPQEEDAGCLAACTQMILAGLNIHISQTELNQLFELSPLGVPLSRLKRIEQYGLQVTIYRDGTLTDLITYLDQNIPLIIFVRTSQLFYWQEDTQHALVVQGYDDSLILVNDPAFPNAPQKSLADELMLAWDEFYNTYAKIIQL
jgi:ABC-type bacteriocin/lantibiotic exporter with double-glycine peptidase domain